MPDAPKTFRPPWARSRQDARKAYDRKRDAEKPSRGWYDLAIWRGPNGIRARQLAAEPLCRRCKADGDTVEATTVNHIGGHGNDWHRFIDGPFESLCKWHHDSEAQSEERRHHVKPTSPRD